MADFGEISRRELLSAIGAGVGFLAAGTVASGGCNGRAPTRGVLGAANDLNQRVQRALFSSDRLAPDPGPRAITPRGEFPQYFHGEGEPLVPDGWHLKVGGMVRTPIDLTLDDLRRLTRTDMRVRHHCVEGWSAVASWHGVQMQTIAELVGADPAAGFVEFRSFDNGYYSSWDRESALHPQTLIAYGMNGEALPPGHGAPARLYGATKLGYKSVKFLTEILFMPHAAGGTWEDLGYEWFAGV